MNYLVALAVIAVVEIARWRFQARLPVTAVAVVDWAMRFMAALGLASVVLTALELFLWLPRFSIVPIYAVMYILVSAATRSVQRQTSDSVPGCDDEPNLDLSQRSISGPIGRFGPYGLMATFYSSQSLCLFNPFQVAELVRQAAGNAALVRREKRSSDDGRGYETQVAYTLPFDGEWLVANGGNTPTTSHSWDIPGQRFRARFLAGERSPSDPQWPGNESGGVLLPWPRNLRGGGRNRGRRGGSGSAGLPRLGPL